MKIRGAIVFFVSLFVVLSPVASDARPRAHDANGNATVIIGKRPPGCPSRYCGCALRLFLGLGSKRLNQAAAWLSFPHSPPKPGAVAVRPHHVMQLVSHVSGDVWIVRDYNSGRGLSRIHPRSVRGFTFVTPAFNNVSLLAQISHVNSYE